ncbi:hypothetical protein [Aquabacterium sp. OR-4]|uniref:hypothetical protein n=1 Tax=Aquabacterium sp. OR-4 TaxID=2978127 RepID=UPI0028C86085|nr:hypothetical protein [Aquabacterium sp. OR-4]MDT7835051.1 hypothetical protein [Aquabacterium sp. OR-4]
MPLVELGLVSRLDSRDAARLDTRPPPSQRLVRCAAGFYGDAQTAQAVAAQLGALHGLHHEQVALIHPAGLTRAGFAQLAQRWQKLRPHWGLRQQAGQVLLAALGGLLLGGLVAALAWLLLPASEPAVELTAWMGPGLLAGALAGGATRAVMGWREPRHRFDETVARKLRRGYSVVLAHGLSPAQEAPVLAHLQDSSHSWCAEAPRRAERL